MIGILFCIPQRNVSNHMQDHITMEEASFGQPAQPRICMYWQHKDPKQLSNTLTAKKLTASKRNVSNRMQDHITMEVAAFGNPL